MSDVVIVAIPAEDDPVWKVSSEKIPHLTLCFLKGPLENEENTIRFVEHAVKTSLSRFGLSVDRRGVLGKDDADVLFFDKRYSGKELLAFRGYLLSNKDISAAYQKAEQYPIWTPHLTLGYPKAPANEMPEHGIHWVNFDRVAVWTSDFSGPEFVLKSDSSMEVDIDASWSADELGEHLEHFGVRGMKWGVRKDRGYEGQRASTRKIKKLDKKYNKSLIGVKGYVKVNNAVANRINPKLNKLNDNPKYKDIDLLAKPALHKTYLNEYKKLLEQSCNEAMADIGFNASGTQRIHIEVVGTGMETTYQAFTENIKHADIPNRFSITPYFNKTGHITGQTVEEESLVQSELDFDNLEDVLIHFGVRGMKWGVRKDADGIGVSAKTARAAKSDATEFTKAKLFYGEGAGTRRKLIKARVEQRSKVNPDYKKAFDHYVGKTNLAKRADQATSTRRRKDVTKSVGKTARGVKNAALGNPGHTTVTALALVAAGQKAHQLGYDKKALDALKSITVNPQNKKIVQDILRNLGVKHDDLEDGGHFIIDDDDTLMHFGVRGMKWGVRRPIGSNGLINRSARAERAQGRADKLQTRATKQREFASKTTQYKTAEKLISKSYDSDAKKAQRRATRLASPPKGKTEVQKLVKKVQAKTPAAKRKELDDKLLKLSTQDIQTINNRIRATQEYRKLSAQEKLRTRSSKKKFADWVLGINQPPKNNNKSSLKDKVEVAKLANKLINDVVATKKGV